MTTNLIEQHFAPEMDLRPRLDTPMAGPSTRARIFDRFLAACDQRPHATAIAHARGAWSYAQLERASRALAVQLLAQPATDDVVALYARRSGELVVGMLACLRAGLTFAVLDAAYPAERLEQLLEVARPGRFVAIGATAADEAVLARLTLPRALLRLDAKAMDGLVRGEAPQDGRLDQVSAGSIAYLLFTSGTTGVPKCIETSHVPLVHFIDWYAKAFTVDERCRFSMLSGLGHDPILRDVFVPLSTGAELHVPAPALVLEPEKLYAWVADARVTHAHVTPQLCRILCAGRRERKPLAALRFVFSGGDTLRSKQAKEVIQAAPAARVVNFYGSTETPQAMGHHVFDPRVDDVSDVVPVGRGIADVQLLVVDDGLELAAVEARGQIAIRTRFLSAGYRGDASLTRKKFRANPCAQDPGDQLYLTGDAGHFRRDGAVVIQGRLDDQVKIRGFRVELGDVVRQLERIASVKEAVVLPGKTPDGESHLVAYLIGRPGAVTDAEATSVVKQAMAASSPAYMVPARYVWLLQFPLLPNGKIDRARLAGLESLDTSAGAAPPLDPIEAKIVAQWKQRLSRPTVDAGSSFVELGGDSLSFIEAAMELEVLLGWLPDGWEKLSIRELARAKRARRSRWTRVDSSVFLRAISIIAVVAGHFDLPDLTGSVRALFVVSGMSFARYLVPQVLRTERVSAIARLVLKIAIPTVLYTLLINVVFGRPRWPGMFLINNLVSPEPQIGGLGFWFIDVLTQCLFFLALLLSVKRVRQAVAKNPFGFALAAALLFDGISLVAPYVWDTTRLHDRVPHHYLGAICLGWAVVNADSPRRKLLVAAATLLTFAGPAYHSPSLLLFPFVASFFLLLQPQLTLPVHVGRLVNLVAGASLFIYLLDHQVEWALGKVGLAAHPVVGVAIAVVAGVVVRKGWEKAASLVWRGRREADEPAAAASLS
jgi:amino acid adenylation domain-containing protein